MAYAELAPRQLFCLSWHAAATAHTSNTHNNTHNIRHTFASSQPAPWKIHPRSVHIRRMSWNQRSTHCMGPWGCLSGRTRLQLNHYQCNAGWLKSGVSVRRLSTHSATVLPAISYDTLALSCHEQVRRLLRVFHGCKPEAPPSMSWGQGRECACSWSTLSGVMADVTGCSSRQETQLHALGVLARPDSWTTIT